MGYFLGKDLPQKSFQTQPLSNGKCNCWYTGNFILWTVNQVLLNRWGFGHLQALQGTNQRQNHPAKAAQSSKPHPLLCTQMLMLHFMAMQKAQQLITVNYNLRFPLNIPEIADLEIHWQEHSSHSRSGSPPEWGVPAGREEKEKGKEKTHQKMNLVLVKCSLPVS